MSTENPYCPHCGQELGLFSPEKIAVLVSEIKLDPSLVAKKEINEKRLKACDECDALRDEVMCSHCGCFILFRARLAKSYCPHPAGDRWK